MPTARFARIRREPPYVEAASGGHSHSIREWELDGAVLLVTQSAVLNSDQLLRSAASKALNAHSRSVFVQRLCRQCGGDNHGQPHVLLGGRVAEECSVSFSRVEQSAVAAARIGARIGVDIESVARIARHTIDDVLLHPRERPTFATLRGKATTRYLAQLWVAKEAILKLTGHGLRIDPRQLFVQLDGLTGRLESWPPDLEFANPPRLSFFDVSADIVGALAVSE